MLGIACTGNGARIAIDPGASPVDDSADTGPEVEPDPVVTVETADPAL